MNNILFLKAIAAARCACISQNRLDFVAATRVAQSTMRERQRIVRLLDAAIAEFPSAKCQRIINIVADRVAPPA